VMLGVRTSIGSTNAKMNLKEKRWLSSDDFMATEKYEFRPSGGPKTPAHQLGHTFKFKDYSPVAFAYLRRLFGINEFDFLLSVCGNANFIEFISNAKSGQFFFYSRDGKFMIKTMTNAESKFLRRILPHYFRHCSQNPNTLITKFLGMYRVKLYHLRRNVKFVIMNSVYYTDKFLQLFYDLKGSVTGRMAKPHQDVKKDNDLRKVLPDGAIILYPAVRSAVRKQLVADCDFMRRMKIMDYSMLIGIHHIPPKGSHPSTGNQNTAKHGFRFSDSKGGSFKLRDLVRSSRNIGTRSHEGSGRSLSASSGLFMEKLAAAESDGDGAEKTQEIEKSLMAEIGVDDDDDNSYLEGSEKYVASKPSIGPSTADPDQAASLELKKQQTIEQVYWPFHRLFDIHGYRRMVPGPCSTCGSDSGCSCEEEEIKEARKLGIRVASFVPPLSDRRDGGLEMDTTGIELPMKMKASNGKEQLYDGRIFYMGIIDILQQYNIRKRFEARYRRISGSGWQDASCVHPNLYAERFIRFFDEYSRRTVAGETPLEDGEESIRFDHTNDDDFEVHVDMNMDGSSSTIEVSPLHK